MYPITQENGSLALENNSVVTRFRVDLLSYESKPTDKRQQTYWRAEKNLDDLLVEPFLVYSSAIKNSI